MNRFIKTLFPALLVMVWLSAFGKEGVETGTHYFDTRTAVFSMQKVPVETLPGKTIEEKIIGNFSENGTTIVLHKEIESPAGKHFLFKQQIAGFSVFDGWLKVNTDRNGIIQNIFDCRFDPDHSLLLPLINELKALDFKSIAGNYASLHFSLPFELEADPVFAFLPDETQTLVPLAAVAIIVHEIQTHRYIQALISPAGELLFERDLNAYHSRQQTDTLAFAYVFLPDPLTTALVNYGPPFVDNNDSDSPELTMQRRGVQIPVKFQGGEFILENNWVKILEFSTPVKPPVTSAVGLFDYTRSQSGFEDVNALFHITSFQVYMRSLGFNNLVDYPIHVDTHALDGDDQSMFSSSTQPPRLFFGEGGVDDAEDADVIIHEYGHAISFSAAPSTNFGNDRRALDEGFGDYLAASYSKSLSTWAWSKVFTWDGHNEYWSGRNADSPKIYPKDLGSSIHRNGEIWASALMDLWLILGQQTTDRLALQSMYNYAPNMTMPHAALLLLQADSLLNNGVNTCLITEVMAARGLLPGFALEISAGNDTTICRGTTIQIGQELIVPPGFSLTWLPNLELSDNQISTPWASPSESRTYSLFLTELSCGITKSDTIKIEVTSCIEQLEIRNTEGFSKGESPALLLIPDFMNTLTIELFDVTGKRIFRETVSNHNGSYPIEGTGLSAGVYLLKVTTGKSRLSHKLVKTR